MTEINLKKIYGEEGVTIVLKETNKHPVSGDHGEHIGYSIDESEDAYNLSSVNDLNRLLRDITGIGYSKHNKENIHVLVGIGYSVCDAMDKLDTKQKLKKKVDGIARKQLDKDYILDRDIY